MAFTQFKLDVATTQARGIFNQYVYETGDTIAETQAVGYFEQSRFADRDTDWFGSFITCKCFDGSYTGEITTGGTVTPLPESESIPLSVTKYVDAGTLATSRNGSVGSPYNSIAEALAAITDNAIGKRYTLKVAKDDGFSFQPKPFIGIVGDSRDAVAVGTIAIQNIAGDYEFDNLLVSSVTSSNLNLSALTNFRNCVIQGTSTMISLGASTSNTIFTNCNIIGDLDITRMPVEFFDCTINDISFADIGAVPHDWIFNGVIFKGAYIATGTNATNSARFVNCDWRAGTTFSAVSELSVITDDSSFPFFASANVTVTEKLSKGSLVDATINDVIVFIARSTALAQAPSIVDSPIQIEFGPAQLGPTDAAQISSLGAITINETRTYRFTTYLSTGRAGAAGVSIIYGRLLINGAQPGGSVEAMLDNADVVIPLEFTATLPLTVGDIVTFELYRDSTGNNSGGLVLGNPTLAGWNDAATAVLTLTHLSIE